MPDSPRPDGPSNRRNCTLSEFPAPISCGPTERGLIRSNEILTHTSAGNVAGFLGVIQVVIVMGFDMCLMETACTDCFSVAIGPGSDMSLMETACDGCFEVVLYLLSRLRGSMASRGC